MSQLPSNLGSPIQASLNLNAGGGPGNPYSALASGGLAGLGAAYGQSYNNYLGINSENYNNIIQGYGTLGNNIANTLGQGGNGWGVAGAAAKSIAAQGAQQTGGALQNSISNGTGNNSTSAVAAQRSANLNTEQAYAGLGDQLASTYAGYQANLGQSELGFMNSVNAPPPNAGAYNQLAQQYGQQQASAQQYALQQQALQMTRPSMGSGGSSGGGGKSTPQMPGMPGATYQPSGGGVQLPGQGTSIQGPQGSMSFNPYSLVNQSQASGATGTYGDLTDIGIDPATVGSQSMVGDFGNGYGTGFGGYA